jgi:membrane-associated protease RseP (regulator of RpoE activity)
MSGPKHLWSGDWERESAATSGAEADQRQDHQDPTVGENAARTPVPTPETRAGTEHRNGRIAVAVTLVVLVIAVIVIVATNGGSDSRQLTSAAAIPSSPTNPSLTSPTPTNPGQTAPNLTIPNPTTPNPTTPNPTTPNPTTPTPNPATPPTTTTTSSTTTAPTVAPRPVSWLGMEILTIPSGAAVIDAVTPGGAGDRAGLTPGDTIVEVDGHQVSGSASIARAASGRHKGETVTVTVVRGGTTLDVQTRFTGPPTGYP